MKIILFSDIHANLPAFEAALQLIDEIKPDALYCLGDLVGYNVWPNEVINLIRSRQIPCIAGNHDAKVQLFSERQLAEPGPNYAYGLIGEQEKDYLAGLPAHIRLEFKFGENTFVILLVHGSPTSNDEYLLQDKPEEQFLAVCEKAGADILCFGHSHKPYYRVMKSETEGRTRFRHAINTGSVGKPKDGNPQGGFVILDISPKTSKSETNSVAVKFVRFDYDIDKAATAIERRPLPREFAVRLRSAN